MTEVGQTQRGLPAHTDADRFPDLDEVLQRLIDSDRLPKHDVQRLEVTCQANGEATCRVWAGRREDPEGCFLEPPETL